MGAVSPNVRRVSFDRDGEAVVIRVLLERDDSDDREEIADVGFEFEALREVGIGIRLDVICGARPFGQLEMPDWAVDGRGDG